MKIENKIEMLKELKAWTEKYNVRIENDESMVIVNNSSRELLVEFPIGYAINDNTINCRIRYLASKLPRCPFCGSELMREHNIRGHYLHCVNDDCRYSGPFCNSIKEAEKQNHFAFGVLTLLRENGEQNED